MVVAQQNRPHRGVRSPCRAQLEGSKRRNRGHHVELDSLRTVIRPPNSPPSSKFCGEAAIMWAPCKPWQLCAFSSFRFFWGPYSRRPVTRSAPSRPSRSLIPARSAAGAVLLWRERQRRRCRPSLAAGRYLARLPVAWRNDDQPRDIPRSRPILCFGDQ